ncbi:MAG: hypothetical protein WAV95_04525 [Azonexus sp.]
MILIARFCLSLLLLLSVLPALAEEADHADAHTIRAADFPAHPPRFEQYPVREIHAGPLARPDVRSLARSRIFRTMIRQGARSGVNFAGHYSIVSWGCGTGCRGLAVVDAVSGKVHHPANLLAIDNNNVNYEDFLNAAGDWDLLRFRPDSRLIVVIGGINEEPARRGISYFVWENDRLKRIRFVHKAYE